MNKDIIRAHNEVMHVIGVAEPDPSTSNNWAAYSAKLHSEYENNRGGHLLRIGRLIFVAGIWGVHGVRQRILVRLPLRRAQCECPTIHTHRLLGVQRNRQASVLRLAAERTCDTHGSAVVVRWNAFVLWRMVSTVVFKNIGHYSR